MLGKKMRNWFTSIVTIAVSASTLFGDEVTTRNLDDVISEVPKPGGGGFITREVSKVKGFYRGKTLVLLEYTSELTVAIEGKESSVTNYKKYCVVANELEVVEIRGDTFTLFSVSSPWPIDVTHVSQVNDGKGSGYSHICIPEIGFFEELEFKDGKLLPLRDGDKFEEFKEFKLDYWRKNLKEDKP
jgi:hypothetical protein